MYIARILYPVEVLGPGKRIGIWFAGCHHHCKGCSNPELWDQPEKYHTSVDTVMALVNSIAEQHQVDGFTLTGGDPMEQADELPLLLEKLSTISSDILMYTGYLYNEISDKDVLKFISVLIDGPYQEDRNHGQKLIGSDNQTIYYLKPAMEGRYKNYLADGESQIQNFTSVDGIVSVGIHRVGYELDLDKGVKERGLQDERLYTKVASGTRNF